jgi:hypothetical protein
MPTDSDLSVSLNSGSIRKSALFPVALEPDTKGSGRTSIRVRRLKERYFSTEKAVRGMRLLVLGAGAIL